MTSKNDDARQQRNARLRAGLRAATVTATLLAAAWGGGSTAAASPAPESGHLYWTNRWIGRANINGTDVNKKFMAVPNGPQGVSGLAVNSRYIYWTDETAGTIGRANLNGTGVNQRFITGAHFPETGLTVDSRYLYWANNGSGTIGRANLNGTGVNQRFIITKPNNSPLGLYGVAVEPGQ
jgi:virginiamycin B lyase